MTPKLYIDIDGGFTLEVGHVVLSFPEALVERMQTMCDGGTKSFIMVTDLIEKRFVECMEIDGRFYYKTDLRDAIQRGIIPHKERE